MPKQKIKKGNAPVLALAVGAAALAAAGIIFYFSRNDGVSNTATGNRKTISAEEPRLKDAQDAGQSDTAGWKTYRSADQKLEFKYPAEKLSLASEYGNPVLSHSVPFRHADPCDMRDGAKELANITDFKVNIEHVKSGLAEAVKSHEPAFFIQDYLDGNALKVSPQYIDAEKLGSFSGYKITSSGEGCGEYVYYLVLDPRNTLRVSRAIVAEFQPVNTNYRENMKIPGTLQPREEDKLFNEIGATLKFDAGRN